MKITEPTLTGNAIFLTGVISGSLYGSPSGHKVVEARAPDGEIIVESETGNRFSVLVRQIEGQE